MQHQFSRTKQIAHAFCVGAFTLTSILAVSFMTVGGRLSKTTVSFDTYRLQLSEISESYERENRIIVFSSRAIEDKNCIASASGYGDMYVFQYASEKEAQEALAYYSSLPYVESAMPDSAVNTQEDVSDADGEIVVLDHLTWGAEILGVDSYQAAIEQIYGTVENMPDVYVAVLDTGIDTDNEFLQGRIAYEWGKSFYRSDLYRSGESEYEFEDDHMHGTHVAGTIVDLTPDNVKIIPVKVLDSGGVGDVSDLMLGIQYVLELKEREGLNIVAMNMSLAADSTGMESTFYFDEAYEKDIMSVVAAGNDSYYAEEVFPANCESALTVSALSQNVIYENFPFVSYYSNYGKSVDLCLPGTNVLSCVPDGYNYSENYVFSTTGGTYAYLSGTSMATPHATALVALYATYLGECFNAPEVERALKQNVYDLGSTGRDDLFGYGVPSMDLALADRALTAIPELSYGEVGSSYHFANTISVTIENKNPVYDGMAYEIYYTLDGSYPTLCGNHRAYGGGIPIEDSTHLSFVIYLFDEEGFVRGHSRLYEVEYFKGEEEDENTRGVGFEINENGILTRYTSGLQDVVIPESVNGIKVRELGNNLFFGLNVRSITCEADVSLYNKYAQNLEFPIRYCPNLQRVELGSSDAGFAVSHCFALKELILTNAEEISDAPFLSFELGYSYLGTYTAYGCSALERVVAPKAKSVGNYAFSYVTTLKEVVLPEATVIWHNAFEECTALTTVELPSVRNIMSFAFAYCRNLKTVKVPALNYIDEYAFAYCPNLTTVESGTATYFGAYAFLNCTGLKELDTRSAETIKNFAFQGCSGLERLDFSSVKDIGENVMMQCSNVKVVYCGSNKSLIDKSVNWADWIRRYGNLQYLVTDFGYTSRGGLLSNIFFTCRVVDNKYRVYTKTDLFLATFLDKDGEEFAKEYRVEVDALTLPKGISTDDYEIIYLSWRRSSTGDVVRSGDEVFLMQDETFTLADHNVYYSAYAEQAKAHYAALYNQLAGQSAPESDPVYAAIEEACTVSGGLQVDGLDRASVLKKVNDLLGDAVCDLLDGLLLETDSEAVRGIVAAAREDVLNACDTDVDLVELDGIVESALRLIAEQRRADAEAARTAARTVAKEALRERTKDIYEGLSAARKDAVDELYRNYEDRIDAAEESEYAEIIEECRRAFIMQSGIWSIDDVINGSEDEHILEIAQAAQANIQSLADKNLAEEELRNEIDAIVAQAKEEIEEYLASQEVEEPPVTEPEDPDDGEDPDEGEEPDEPEDPDDSENPDDGEDPDEGNAADPGDSNVGLWIALGCSGIVALALIGAVTAVLIIRKKKNDR